MGWEAWLTLSVVVGCFAIMAFTWASPDITMSAGLTLLLVVIATSFGIGAALQKSGAAGVLADGAIGLAGVIPGPHWC